MQKGQGFVQGAFILMFANVIVKLIGALFKIPLANMIEEQAMGYFSSAYSIFTTFFIISTAGLPVAMSRMIAAAHARADDGEVHQIFRVGMRVFLILGGIGTAIMVAISPIVEKLTTQTGLSFSLWALAPTLFFIGIISAYRGYFQGRSNMIPTAVSQTIEALGKLVCGLCLAYFAKQAFPGQTWLWAAFAILGVTIGVVFSFVYLFFTKSMVAHAENTVESRVFKKRSSDIFKELIRIAIPITLAAVMINLTSNIDVFTIVPLLATRPLSIDTLNAATPELARQINSDVANTFYGAYTAHAVTLFNLVPALTQAFSISCLPAISAALAQANQTLARRTMDSSIKIVSCITLPATFGMIALSAPIVSILFGKSPMKYTISAGELKETTNVLRDLSGNVLTPADVSAPLLAILAVSIFLAGLYSTTGSILQACGQEKKSIVSAISGILTKLISACILISIPQIGILGAPISTTLCYLVMLLLNFIFLHKHAEYTPKISDFFLRPLAASLLCAATAFGLYTGLSSLTSSVVSLGCAIIAAVFVYFVTLMLVGGLNRDDVEMLPKGASIARLLTKVKLLK